MLPIRDLSFLLILVTFSQNLFAEEWAYTFRPRDTLWDLCAKYVAAPNCWQKIAQRNNIEKPKQIKPGTRLYLPISWLKVLPVSAKVLSVRGEAILRRAGSDNAETLSKSEDLLVGDHIITHSGTVTLQFADESILIVTPGSEIHFDTLSVYGESGMVDTRVRLNRGRARAKVKPVKGPGSRYEILTPAAVAAVRGTDFRVISEDADPPQMKTEVVEGVVAVGNDVSQEAVNAGYALKAVSGEPLKAPIKLLEAPAFTSALPDQVRAFPWELAWQGVVGAIDYRLQIYSRGLIFDELVSEQRIQSTSFSLPRLEEGRYEILVRAIDKSGFEGMEAQYPFTVEEPMVIDAIEVSAVLSEKQGKQMIQWRWQEMPGVDKYKVHLVVDNRAADTQDKVVEVVSNEFSQPIKGAGTYRLKVAPVVGKQQLAYSDIKTFTVRSEDEAPLWVKVIVGVITLLAIF